MYFAKDIHQLLNKEVHGETRMYSRYGIQQELSTKANGDERRRTGHVMSPETVDACGDIGGGGQLTMGIIGCLPDNVQQAIKSFSIRNGKQHVTLAFPFMEDLVKGFGWHRGPIQIEEEHSCKLYSRKGVSHHHQSRQPIQRFQNITPAMFFDRCPEVLHGFETLVTLVPNVNRSSHLIGLLTVNQKNTSEGVRRHIESLFKIMVTGKTVTELGNLPLLAFDLKGRLLQDALEAGANAVLEVHGETFARLYPGKSYQQLLHIVKERIIGPTVVSYHELLQLNIQEVKSRLGNEVDLRSAKLNERTLKTDSSYFQSIMELLQSTSCSLSDFRQVHLSFMNPNIEESVLEFWRLWSHEEVASKVFPILSNKSKTGSLHYFNGPTNSVHSMEATNKTGVGQESCESFIGNIITRVPVKEGLASIIKGLKNQDNTILSLAGITRYNSKTIGLESAFHPPKPSNTIQRLSSSPENIRLVKPITSYPSNIMYSVDKSFNGVMNTNVRMKEISQPNQSIDSITTLSPPFPFLFGYYGSVKTDQQIHSIPRPLITMHSSPFLCCHWGSFDHELHES